MTGLPPWEPVQEPIAEDVRETTQELKKETTVEPIDVHPIQNSNPISPPIPQVLLDSG